MDHYCAKKTSKIDKINNNLNKLIVFDQFNRYYCSIYHT